ncbi:unnamed protein product [Anisakis simplex]|uniref:BZIP domain-containing protein n=1 Tax=Anisakis simplex TaxID=6269 RepID=A0A0M3KHF4_ANISI|nr:unnamed protein product [Anisakis simplex]
MLREESGAMDNVLVIRSDDKDEEARSAGARSAGKKPVVTKLELDASSRDRSREVQQQQQPDSEELRTAMSRRSRSEDRLSSRMAKLKGQKTKQSRKDEEHARKLREAIKQLNKALNLRASKRENAPKMEEQKNEEEPKNEQQDEDTTQRLSSMEELQKFEEILAKNITKQKDDKTQKDKKMILKVLNFSDSKVSSETEAESTMSTQQPSSASAISMGAFSTAKSLVSGLLQGVQKTGGDPSTISPNSDTSGTRITLASPTPTSTPTTGVSGATSRTSGMFTSTGSDMTSSLVSMHSTKTVNSSSSSSSSNFVGK